MSTASPRMLRLHVPGHEERKITWLELFYDLIYVATIIQLGNLLVADASAVGGTLFVLLFVPVWWSWTGMMFFFNRFVADDVWHRVLVFAQMFAIANLAISVTGAFGEMSAAFALAYFAVRAILVLFYLRAWGMVPDARPLIRRYLLGFSLAALVWLASAFVPEPYRYALWAAALALEFYVSVSAGSRRLQYQLPPDIPHLAERYGLFTIIVLGESFIKVVSGLGEYGITLDSLLLSALGFVVAACIWWLYFDSSHGAVVRSSTGARYVWIYGHLPLTVAITGIGVGLKKLTVLPLGDGVSDTVRWVLGGALALCLLTLALFEAIKVSERPAAAAREVGARLGGSVAVLAVVVFGASLPAAVMALLFALVCVALVVLAEATNAAAAAGAGVLAEEGAAPG